MSRFKAASVHFLISVAVFSIFLVFVFFIWYAYPFNLTQGVAEIVYLMAGVDIVLGPLLTLVVFNTAKKSLKFDLSIIGAFQLAALLYGGYIIYSERPAWIVHTVDRLEVVGLYEVNVEELTDKSLDVGVFDKPRLIYVEPPVGEEASIIVFESLAGGKDLDRRPKYYRSFTQHASEIVKSLGELDKHPSGALDSIDTDDLGYLPVEGKIKSIVALVNKHSGQVEGYEITDPWGN